MDLISYWTDYCVPYVKARLSGDEAGASLVEDALLVALIGVLCMGAVTFLGNTTKGKFSTVGSSLS